MYCMVHFIQSFATFSFYVWTSIYPQIPDFKSFIEKIGALDLNIWSWTFPCPEAAHGTRFRLFGFVGTPGPLWAHGKPRFTMHWHIWFQNTGLFIKLYTEHSVLILLELHFVTWANDFGVSSCPPPPFSSTLFSLEMTVGTCAIEVSESLSRERIWSFFIIFSSADSLRKLLAWNNFEGEGQEDKAHFLFLLWKWTWFWCPVW